MPSEVTVATIAAAGAILSALIAATVASRNNAQSLRDIRSVVERDLELLQKTALSARSADLIRWNSDRNVERLLVQDLQKKSASLRLRTYTSTVAACSLGIPLAFNAHLVDLSPGWTVTFVVLGWSILGWAGVRVVVQNLVLFRRDAVLNEFVDRVNGRSSASPSTWRSRVVRWLKLAAGISPKNTDVVHPGHLSSLS